MLFVGLAATFMTAPKANGDELTKKTILTVNEPTQIDKVLLQPGQYVLRLLEQQTDRHVVEIYDRNEKHILGTVVAIPTERLQEKGKTTFTFYETPAGSVKALRAWYYPGDNYGQRFEYPKNLQASATTVTTQTQTTAATNQTDTTTTAAATPAPAPEPQPAQEQSSQEADREATPAPAPAQTEVASNAAPAEQPAAQPAPEPKSANPPAELPATGSSYPAIGLLGAALMALAGVSRMVRARGERA